MILIKDRHSSSIESEQQGSKSGNMILIKDRHNLKVELVVIDLWGKYDTYKGSTPNRISLERQPDARREI